VINRSISKNIPPLQNLFLQNRRKFIKGNPMKKFITLLILCVSMLLLGACTAKSTTTSVTDETEVAISQATPATIVPVSLEPPVDNCVVCHTDKQMLIDTAEVEEESHEAESEGVG
jgi:uncharacterized membrane protein